MADLPHVPRGPAPSDGRPWWHGMNRYHWFVLTVAALGWLFDCLDQQLFNLARKPAMETLLAGASGAADPKDVAWYGSLATCIFLLGWATGGLVFGVIGDRYGRAKTMMITIVIYSLCTGLSALSRGFWDFAFYRFITGLGVGGEFAVGVSLVAEVMPERARPHALGLLQALSAVGNFLAASIGIGLGELQIMSHSGKLAGWEPWRWKFVIGALPAVLALVIRAGLEEPERWRELKARAAHTGEALGGYRALFADARWRRNALVGMLLACAGVIGLWGIAFFSVDLVRSVLQKQFVADGLSGAELAGKLTKYQGYASMMIQVGAFASMSLAAPLCLRIGRKPFFAIALVAAMLSTAMVFRYLSRHHRHLVDAADHGLLPAVALRRLCHLLSRVVPHPAAEHGYELLLQRRPVRGGERPLSSGAALQQRLQRHPESGLDERADAAGGDRHVRRLPAGARRAPVPARDQGQAAAGVTSGPWRDVNAGRSPATVSSGGRNGAVRMPRE